MKQLFKAARKTTLSALGLPHNQVRATPTLVNEAINSELECIFIAVPKTGTTSVRRQIGQEGIPLVPNPHLDIMQVRDLLYPFLLMSSLGKNRAFPSDSVPEDRELRKRSADDFSGFYKFSAVRNPWARAVSIFQRREGIQLGAEITFETFCEQHLYASDTCHHPTLHRNQIDWLCDEEGSVLMDFVYKVEELDAAITRIAEETNGRIRLQNKQANRNPNSRSANYQEMYNEKTRRLIAKHFEKDIDYFHFTF